MMTLPNYVKRLYSIFHQSTSLPCLQLFSYRSAIALHNPYFCCITLAPVVRTLVLAFMHFTAYSNRENSLGRTIVQTGQGPTGLA